MEMSPFNVKYASTTSLDRAYRVYFEDAEFYFLRIGGQGGDIVLDVIDATFSTVAGAFIGVVTTRSVIGAIIFAIIGWILGSLLQKKARESQARHINALDRSHPKLHLNEHKHNFKLNPVDLQDSRIEPPSFFPLHGPEMGRWISNRKDGRKIDLHFEDTENLKTAVGSLPEILGQKLIMNVAWNEKNKRFTKLNS